MSTISIRHNPTCIAHTMVLTASLPHAYKLTNTLLPAHHPPTLSKRSKFLQLVLQEHFGWCVTLISHDVSQLSSALNFSVPTRWPSRTDVGRHCRGGVRGWLWWCAPIEKKRWNLYILISSACFPEWLCRLANYRREQNRRSKVYNGKRHTAGV